MSDDMTLHLLRAIRADVAEKKLDISEIKERLGPLGSQYSSVSRRVDRIGGELGVMRRRFDVADAT